MTINAHAWLVAGCLGVAAAATQAVDYKIVTASERGTYIQIGRDLAEHVAPAAGIELAVLPSAGSAENVQRLRHEPGVKLAMVQSDVYQAFLDEAAQGNAAAEAMIRPLRVVMPLYNEEIYFIVRADSPLRHVHDMKGARINIGPLRSGTALSATTIYRQMFGEPIAPGRESHLSNEDALRRLVSTDELDVVVVVAGQPAKLLSDMAPDARRFIRLLDVDAQHPASQAALSVYFPATIKASSYPNLLQEDMAGLAVRAYLVTFNYFNPETTSHLARFARSLCGARDALREQGHPKWREIEVGVMPPLGRGWTYYGPTRRELDGCVRAPAPQAVPAARCTSQQLVLGLCS